MTDKDESAKAADLEDVRETEEPEGEQPEGEGQETEDAEKKAAEEEERRKETSRERREREKERKRQLWRERNEAIARAEKAEARARRIMEAGKGDAPPRESEFSDPIEFAAAKAVWKQSQATAKRDADAVSEEAAEARKQAEEAAAREKAMVNAAWSEQVHQAKTRYADFEQVAYAAPISDDVAELVRSSDVGADVAYYLGQHRALAHEISLLPPVEAARAIGRIEASLTTPKPRTETRAPEPIAPVKANSQAGRDPRKMTPREFSRWRAEGGTFDL